MKRLGFLLLFLLVLACKGSTGPALPVGEYCLSNFEYKVVTDVGDTLRTTDGTPYGALICMTFEGNNVSIGSNEGAAFVDAVVIYSDGISLSGPLVIWYGGVVTAKIFFESGLMYLSDASGDLYWLAFPKTQIKLDGRTITTDYHETASTGQFQSVDLHTDWIKQ